MNDALTCRVRIAVAVNDQGYWSASGWNTQTHLTGVVSEARETALDSIDGGDRVHVVWVEATVPIPELYDLKVEGSAGEPEAVEP